MRRWGKVLVIAGCWTALLVLSYVSTYLFIGDLIAYGKLSGSYDFWPDFAGNAIVGVFGGLIGGALLVFRGNPGYRHRTFLSEIVRSIVAFVLIYGGAAAVVLFAMPFVVGALRGEVAAAVRSGFDNLAANLYTPYFVLTMLLFGLIVGGTQFMLQVNDKLGPGVLWTLLTGKYYHPREEERVFVRSPRGAPSISTGSALRRISRPASTSARPRSGRSAW